MAIRTILDTDIGTDCDDLLALSFMLQSPEFRLEGVTCVHGDLQVRGKMVRKILALTRREDIPVRLGASPPLLGLRNVHWRGNEGEGLIEEESGAPFSPEHAADFIVRMVNENPGEIHLLAIGPLTNLALALLKDPSIARKVAHVTVMGGIIRGTDLLFREVWEHNIALDPEAAHIVFSSGAPLTIVPLEVTLPTLIRGEHVDRIRSVGDSFRDAIVQQVESYHGYYKRGHTEMNDPLAAAVIVDPSLVSFIDCNVQVETHGRLTTGATVFHTPSEKYPRNARVAVTVDAPRAESFIIDRIVS
jgi:purine nucleosidase